jgi:hypothetical protein
MDLGFFLNLFRYRNPDNEDPLACQANNVTTARPFTPLLKTTVFQKCLKLLIQPLDILLGIAGTTSPETTVNNDLAAIRNKLDLPMAPDGRISNAFPDAICHVLDFVLRVLRRKVQVRLTRQNQSLGFDALHGQFEIFKLVSC